MELYLLHVSIQLSLAKIHVRSGFFGRLFICYAFGRMFYKFAKISCAFGIFAPFLNAFIHSM
jgi:hypothetical protein